MYLFIDWQPNVDALTLGSFSLRWYSLLWCIGLLSAYLIVQKLYKQQGIAKEKFEPLFLYCFFGVLIGARLGHCLFYEFDYFLSSPKGMIEMILPIHFIGDTWDWKMTGYTGLASHGGAIGLFLGMLIYIKRMKMKAMTVLDNVAIATPFTAFCIRMGNLMNSEIIGSQTDVPWAFIFHSRDAMVNGQLVPRHPSQLYEAIAYLIIFIIGLVIYTKIDRKATNSRGITSTKSNVIGAKVGTGLYFGYCMATIFTFRFFVEFIKKEQVDFEQGMILDMGQLLSIPFIIAGIYFVVKNLKK